MTVDSLHDRLLAALDRRPHPAFAGCAASLRLDGAEVEAAVVGEASRYSDGAGTVLPESEREPVTMETVFDIASVTKLFVAVSLMGLWDDGLLDLDMPVGHYLPVLSGYQDDEITPRVLLSHSSGLPDGVALSQLPHDREQFLSLLQSLPLAFRPGEGYSYSCLGFVLAGYVGEVVSGIDLATLVDRKVCAPLALRDTGYCPGEGLRRRCAATEDESYVGRGMVRGFVHDEMSWALGGVSGNAGIFSTVADVSVFGEAIRQGGEVDGHRIVSEAAVRELTRDQLPQCLPGRLYGQGLGFRLDDPGMCGRLAGYGAVGHTGFTGTSLLVDGQRRLVLTVLSNRVHPNREWADLTKLRSDLANYAADLMSLAA